MIIASPDAYRLTGVNPTMLRNVMERGHFTGLPPASKGAIRYWGRDDVVALNIFTGLVNIEAAPSAAGRIATEVRQILRRRDDIEFIYLVAGTDARGKPHPRVVEMLPPGADELHTFRIAVYRAAAEADIAAIIASKGAT